MKAGGTEDRIIVVTGGVTHWHNSYTDYALYQRKREAWECKLYRKSELNQAFLIERLFVILHKEVNMLHKQPVDI
jgi:hypothetical protein